MRTSRAAALALLAAFTLSACNGGDDPSEPVSTSTPSGKIETPSNTTPTVDPLTEAPKGETAQQFIRRWVALGNKMQETGETGAYLSLAGPDCDSCQKFASSVTKIYENGGNINGGSERIIAFKKESASQWVVTLDADPTEYTEAAGGETKTFSGGRHRSRLYLANVDGNWIVGATETLPR